MKKLFLICVLNFALFSFKQGDSQNIIRKIKIEKGQVYLNLPVRESSKPIWVQIFNEGKVLDRFSIKLADGSPDY